MPAVLRMMPALIERGLPGRRPGVGDLGEAAIPFEEIIGARFVHQGGGKSAVRTQLQIAVAGLDDRAEVIEDAIVVKVHRAGDRHRSQVGQVAVAGIHLRRWSIETCCQRSSASVHRCPRRDGHRQPARCRCQSR